MAALVGHLDILNITSKEAIDNVWLHVDNFETVSIIFVVLGIISAPVIVLGNSLVVLAIWKDPLKKLRRSPSGFVVLSMAIADFLVGLVVCPSAVYWGWSMFHYEVPPISYLTVSAVFVNVSVAHIFLLTIDRFFAVVTPLRYRVLVTPKRITIACITCWSYFLIFGIAFGLLQHEYFIIMGIIYTIQIFCILLGISVMSVVIIYRFHAYCKNTELKHQSTAEPQMILRRERNLCKAIAVVICAYLFCFMPWFVTQIIIHFCPSCQTDLSKLSWSYALSATLMHTNSGVNPFLYAWRLPKYRDTFTHLLKKRTRNCNNQNGQVIDNRLYDSRL